MTSDADTSASPAASEAVVRDNPDQSRFEILLDETVVGHLDYARHGDVLTLIHTETDPAYKDRGLASRLVQTALDMTRNTGQLIRVRCPFVTAYVQKHPEYQDVAELEHKGGAGHSESAEPGESAERGEEG